MKHVPGLTTFKSPFHEARKTRARAFYSGLLTRGDPEAGRYGPGAAERGSNAAGLQLHLGVEEPFSPARKAHPALRIRRYEELLANRLLRDTEWCRIRAFRMYDVPSFPIRLETESN